MQWCAARGLVDFLKSMNTCAAVADAVRVIHRTAALLSCLVPLVHDDGFSVATAWTCNAVQAG